MAAPLNGALTHNPRVCSVQLKFINQPFCCYVQKKNKLRQKASVHGLEYGFMIYLSQVSENYES